MPAYNSCNIGCRSWEKHFPHKSLEMRVMDGGTGILPVVPLTGLTGWKPVPRVRRFPLACRCPYGIISPSWG